MSLFENLPQFIVEEKYTKEILNAIEPEIDKIRQELTKKLLETCVSTCSLVGVEKFETDYSIKFDSNLSLDERKINIINKMLSKKRLTKNELANFIKRNLNNGQYYISNMAEEYQFKVMLVDENYKEKLQKALFEARPAYLNFQIEIVKYERRCGTFNCKK